MKTDVGIYGNMHTPDTPRYKPGSAERSTVEKDANDLQMRHILRELISTSSDLNIRVWLDGVYTNVEDAYLEGGWMNGREVYFKVEGRVLGTRELDDHKPGGS